MVFSRVTNSYMTNLFIQDIRRNLADITELQHQISTGKRVSYPHDDPISADRILDYTQSLAKMDQYIRNIDNAKSEGQNLEGSLDTLYDVLLRCRDLAVRGGAEAPLTQNEYDALADEVDSLIHMLWSESNQTFNGKSIYSGFKTNTEPFTISNELEYVANPGGASAVLDMPTAATGRQIAAITSTNCVTDIEIYNAATATWDSVLTQPGVTGITCDPTNNQVSVTGGATPFNDGSRVRVIFERDVVVEYQGDMGEKSVEIGQGQVVKTNYVGAASVNSPQMSVFGKYSGNELQSGCVDSFQFLFDLRDSLYKYEATGGANFTDIVRGIEDVDTAINSVLTVHAEQGGRDQRLTLAMNRHENSKVDTKKLLSAHEDVDYTEALSELVLQQNVYQAALAAGAQIIQTTLLDFL